MMAGGHGMVVLPTHGRTVSDALLCSVGLAKAVELLIFGSQQCQVPAMVDICSFAHVPWFSSICDLHMYTERRW
jgi:hypothetical protein